MFDLLERTLKGYSKRLEGMAMRERLFVYLLVLNIFVMLVMLV